MSLLGGLEAAAFLGLAIPGETAMLFGGVLAFNGRASLPLMMACATAAAIVGDSLGYELGRRLGDPLRHGALGRRVGEQRWLRAEEYVQRRGGRAVFVGRFVGVLRALVPFVAGATRMPYRRFLLFNALGAVIWAPGFVALGYAAGHSYVRVERLAGRAGLLLGGAVIMLAAVGLAARWITRHPDRALAPLRRAAHHPAAVTLQRRYVRQLGFLAARLNPAAALGLILTVQLFVLVAFGAAFGTVTEDVIDTDGVARLDDPVSRYLIREPWLTAVMRAITDLGSAWVLVPLLFALGLLASPSPILGPFGFLAAALAGASLLTAAIKLFVARPRPDADALVGALGYGFPSGRSTAAAAGWLALAIVANSLTARGALRAAIFVVAGVVIVLVGVSRVYLGVHAPTDVLGGWALGATWLAAVVTATRLLTARHAGRRTPKPA